MLLSQNTYRTLYFLWRRFRCSEEHDGSILMGRDPLHNPHHAEFTVLGYTDHYTEQVLLPSRDPVVLNRYSFHVSLYIIPSPHLHSSPAVHWNLPLQVPGEIMSSRQYYEMCSRPKGKVAGGRFVTQRDHVGESGDVSSSETVQLDEDFPLTCTEVTRDKHGHEVILLSFAAGDPENPFNWSPHRRRFISALLCLMTLFVGLATTAYSSGISRMCRDLDASKELGQMGLFTFNITCAIAPLFLAPFCELAGRRVVYVGAYFCFSIMFIGLALGKSIATILVCRALLGLSGSVGTILVGGTFSDMYPADERARPMALFAYVAILGTVGAPVYAGFIDESIGWRWIQGIQGLSNIPLLILVACGLPETRGGLVLQKRAKTLAAATGNNSFVCPTDLNARSLKELLHESSIKAIHMLLTEPVVFLFGLWIAFAWTITFLFLSVIPITFQEKRGWGEGVGKSPHQVLTLRLCTFSS